ncbi:MAG TPA: hypothetical protein VEX70_00495 [Pyrinomonadaceae bacterium]|jgi:hypothetical protein|nr:hypothetical protein [Pyrinomonadaceae bacterium]
MSIYFKIAAISTLLIFSIFGQQNSSYRSPKGGGGEGQVEAYNKSPCLNEEVYECQASGGRFNWKSCTCEYW